MNIPDEKLTQLNSNNVFDKFRDMRPNIIMQKNTKFIFSETSLCKKSFSFHFLAQIIGDNLQLLFRRLQVNHT